MHPPMHLFYGLETDKSYYWSIGSWAPNLSEAARQRKNDSPANHDATHFAHAVGPVQHV